MTRIVIRLALVIALILFASASPFADEIQRGPNPPFGSMTRFPFDAVNDANLNVHFAIPVVAKGVTEFGPTSENLISSIDLPDGSSYQFTYEQTPGSSGSVTGRLASISLPTGGEISYAYSGSNNGITCDYAITPKLTRTSPDGTWTFSYSENGTEWMDTVTDSAGNSTDYDFQLAQISDGYTDSAYETQRTIYQGSSVLETINTCYNGASSPCTGTTVNWPLTKVSSTISWPSGQTSETATSYNTCALPTEVDEYGYGNGSVGGLVRKTLTSYASLGNNIEDRPSSVAIYASGASNPSSQTSYGYDQGSVTTTSGTPQHVSISGSRGNLTTTTYLVTSSSTISTTATYYDTGTVKTSTDSKGNQTSYAYGTSSCGNSFATSITMPLSLSRSQTWNCNGGLIASSTDENGQTTNYSYDLMNRPAETTYPDGGWKLINYTSENQIDTYTGITTTTPSTSCASCEHDQENLDGLGRQVSKILVSDPEGQTTTSTAYDSLGRVQKRSNSVSDT